MRYTAHIVTPPSANPPASDRLADLSPYVYGTTRLGDDAIPFESRVEMARAVMRSGVWMHASHQYGDALSVLRAAFDQDRSQVPSLIFKIGWESTQEIRDYAGRLSSAVGKPSIDVGQLCLNGALAEDFAAGGECVEELHRIRREGLIGRYLLQVFPWTSDVALAALSAGHAQGLVDGYILYLNPLQRFASNELWELLIEKRQPLVAMRTVAGGDVMELRDVPGAAWKPYLQERAAEVAPIYERSGAASWPEFCVRFAHGRPGVVATVGATSRKARLDEFLAASRRPIQPLAPKIHAEIEILQRRWAAEVDVHGQPGSM